MPPRVPRATRAPANRATSAAPGSGRRAIRAPDLRRALSLHLHRVAASLRGKEFSEFFEFQPHAARRHPRNKPAAITVEKAAAQDKSAEERPRRCQPHRAAPATLSCLVHLPGCECCITFHL